MQRELIDNIFELPGQNWKFSLIFPLPLLLVIRVKIQELKNNLMQTELCTGFKETTNDQGKVTAIEEISWDRRCGVDAATGP